MKLSKTDTGLSLAELAAEVGGTVEGDAKVVIKSAAPIQAAGPEDISFVANPKYKQFVETTQAGALILGPSVECDRGPVLRHDSPYLAFAKVIDLLYPEQRLVAQGIDKTAVVDEDATVDPSVGIGPLCHVDQGSTIGKNCQLASSVVVGKNVRIGDDCLISPGAKILADSVIGNRVIIHAGVVVGSDGFGFAETDTGLKKIKQVGWVEIGDDVEVGANTTIDRGAIGPTRIGRGTKIDNLVQIAHNVEIGENSIIVAQVGISGSTKIGNGVVLAGQVGLVGHIEIGDGVQVGAQSGVNKSIPPGKKMFGYPAREIMETKRIEASLSRLPELFKRVRRLESESSDESAD